MLAFTLHHLLRYRLAVVRENLHRVYPNASADFFKSVESGFYKYLSDLIVEAFVLSCMPRSYVRRCLNFTNIDVALELIDNGKNIAVVFGHYNNWDLLSSTPLHTDRFKVATIYKEIHNRLIDHLMLRTRTRFGSILIEKKQSLRKIIELQRSGEPFVIAYNADQCPSRRNIGAWINFMNIDTPVHTGWATISHKMGHAVLYLEQIKTGHHRYDIICHTLTDDASKVSVDQLLALYHAELTKTIERDPSRWLWSHRKWKHKHE